MQLLVDEQLAQDGEQELAGQFAPVGQWIGRAEVLHRARNVHRAFHVFHLDDARRRPVHLGHAPDGAGAGAARKGRLHLGLALELQLAAKALDESVDLLGHGLQERRELAVRRPVLAGHQHQADGGLAHQEFTVEVVAPDLDDHRHQMLHAIDREWLLGQVDRANRARLDGPLGIEAEIDVLGRAPEALDQCRARLLRRHGRHVFLEDGQLTRDFLGQEIGRGGGHLGHLDKEGAELAHHLGDDLRLRAVVLGVRLEERLDVAQRLDLAADDLQVATHHLHAAQQRIHAVLVAVVNVFQLIDHLDQQRLVGLEDQPGDVQPQISQAAQLGVGHQLVEEGPELVDDGLRHRNRRAGHRFANHVVNEAFGGPFVRQEIARPQVGRDGARLLGQRVGIKRFEDAVDVATELGLADVGFTAELADQRAKGGDDAGGGFGQAGRLAGEVARAAQQAQAAGANIPRRRRLTARRPSGRHFGCNRRGAAGWAGAGTGFAGRCWLGHNGKL